MTRRAFTALVWWVVVSVLWVLVLCYVTAARLREGKEVWKK